MDGILGSYQQILSLHHTENAQPKRLKRSQSRSAKQEQDLFLRFSIKKSLDSIEKAYIVPISKSLSVSFWWNF
ncbi:TolB protein [Vibrio cholerae]|uniref:TolB protein n=1 Tax=Vibrio cholerae TaxID=666 RepID=UPI0004E2C88D|nr:TolB protein [Vibrio cholerae]EGQ8012211.1 TolB protein [Vibrio cholerae]EHY9843797.1 TolB protein [Vibrio cholerae]EII7296507.1 TolB protein [Vibrio cholerae]EJI4016257.1 TolB protein [Vibrio cholerae]EJL6345221.1 TolB protein [Vibrio cholerae]